MEKILMTKASQGRSSTVTGACVDPAGVLGREGDAMEGGGGGGRPRTRNHKKSNPKI